METARRLDADITLMVWEDGGYGLIAWKQDTEFGRHTDLGFGNPDWLGLAKAFGWHGEYVTRSRDLAGAIDRALGHKGPRSEEHTSELQSLMRHSSAVFCLKKKKQ